MHTTKLFLPTEIIKMAVDAGAKARKFIDALEERYPHSTLNRPFTAEKGWVEGVNVVFISDVEREDMPTDALAALGLSTRPERKSRKSVV